VAVGDDVARPVVSPTRPAAAAAAAVGDVSAGAGLDEDVARALENRAAAAVQQQYPAETAELLQTDDEFDVSQGELTLGQLGVDQHGSSSWLPTGAERTVMLTQSTSLGWFR